MGNVVLKLKLQEVRGEDKQPQADPKPALASLARHCLATPS